MNFGEFATLTYGFIVSAEMDLGDAEVSEGLGLQKIILGLKSSLQLFLKTN
jgi:hypothetical protein